MRRRPRRCPTPPRPSPTSPRRRWRRRWRSPGRSWASRPTPCRLAVIGMGKTRRPRAQLRQRRRRHLRRRAASTAPTRTPRMAAATALATASDAGLLDVHGRAARSGRSTRRCGPRARTGRWSARSTSHRAYYERWAKTWEFQALLKARPVAGDRALGEEYLAARQPDGLAGGVAGELRRGRAGDAPPGREARARRGGRPAAQARARAGCATSSSACSCSSSCTAAPTTRCGRARRSRPSTPWPRGGYVGRDDAADPRRVLPAAAHARAPHPAATGCAAPT